MKKAVMFLILLGMILSLNGCQTVRDPNKLYTYSLSEELKTTIKNKVVLKYDVVIYWGESTPDWGQTYYGTIDDWIIVQDCGAGRMNIGGYPCTTEIAGYTFIHDDIFALYAYRDGEVWELKAAYENGLLTKTQIGKIHEKHNDIYAQLIEARKNANHN